MSDDLIARLRDAEPCGVDRCKEMSVRAGCVCSEAAAALEDLSRRLAECESINANLRLQVDVWACEADTQKSTVHECYQIVTGAKGEPGDWSGSKPVREAFNELKARAEAAEARVKELEEALEGLLDVQNGPPLIRDAALYEAAVNAARAALAQQEK